MSETETNVTEQLEYYHRCAENDWKKSIENDDEEGAIYASGKMSALITAMEVVEEQKIETSDRVQ